MDEVQIIHPGTGGVATVPRSSLPHHYASGWRLLADDEKKQDQAPPEPAPMTRAQAAKAGSSKTAPAGEDK